ncbi:MAG: hypothetical protein U0491_02530 [Candidatus Saccharimonadales bacterium]
MILFARLHAAVEERGRDAVVVDDDSDERAVDRLLDVTVPVLLVHRARTVHDLEDLPDLVRVDLLGHHDLDGRVDLLGEQTTGLPCWASAAATFVIWRLAIAGPLSHVQHCAATLK